jgi:hypothetical protein
MPDKPLETTLLDVAFGVCGAPVATPSGGVGFCVLPKPCPKHPKPNAAG